MIFPNKNRILLN